MPENAPTAFVKPRWHDHVWEGEEINRHYYEFCALTELRNGLRSGDLWVEGSHQYRQLEEYLLPPASWQELRQGAHATGERSFGSENLSGRTWQGTP